MVSFTPCFYLQFTSWTVISTFLFSYSLGKGGKGKAWSPDYPQERRHDLLVSLIPLIFGLNIPLTSTAKINDCPTQYPVLSHLNILQPINILPPNIFFTLMSCYPKTRDRVFLFAIFLMGLSFSKKISDFLNKQTTVTTECAGLYLFNVQGRPPRSRYIEDLSLASAFDFCCHLDLNEKSKRNQLGYSGSPPYGRTIYRDTQLLRPFYPGQSFSYLQNGHPRYYSRLLCPIGDLISGLPCTVLETNLYQSMYTSDKNVNQISAIFY